MSVKILVIALNSTAYDLYRDKHKLSRQEAQWVRREENIRGYKNDIPVVAVGNWYESAKCIDAKVFAANAGFKVTEEQI